jgi:hypothetical protein
MIKAIVPSVQKKSLPYFTEHRNMAKDMFYAEGRAFPSMLQSHAIWMIKFQP